MIIYFEKFDKSVPIKKNDFRAKLISKVIKSLD